MRTVKYFLVGVAVGIPLFVSAFFAAGFGHGSYLFFALFLGGIYFIPGALLIFPALYGVYAVIALRAQTAYRRTAIASGVIVLHWAGAAFAIWHTARQEEGLTYLRKVWPHFSIIICGGVITFLVAHWLFLRVARRAAPANISVA